MPLSPSQLPAMLEQAQIGETLFEQSREGPTVRWIKVGDGYCPEGMAKSYRRHWKGKGDARPHFACLRCGDYYQAVDCAFDGHGNAVCLKCRENVPVVKAALKITVPSAYAFADLNQIKPADRRNMIASWPEKNKFMVIVGVIGSGKTHTAWALIKHLGQQGRAVRFIDCKEARQEYVSALNEQRHFLLNSWANSPCLILDSIADVPASDGWKQAVFTLLDRRWNQQKPTLVITKAGGAEFEAIYGADLRSRMNQYRVVLMDDVDRRKSA